MNDLREPLDSPDLKSLVPTLEPLDYYDIRTAGTRRVRRRQFGVGGAAIAVAAIAAVGVWNGLGSTVVPATPPSTVQQTVADAICGQDAYTLAEFDRAYEACLPMSFQGKTIDGNGVPKPGETFQAMPSCVEPTPGQTAAPCTAIKIVTHPDGRVGVEITDQITGKSEHHGAPMR